MVVTIDEFYAIGLWRFSMNKIFLTFLKNASHFNIRIHQLLYKEREFAKCVMSLTLKRLGEGASPLDISRDYSATRKALAATLYDFFLSTFPHILTPNLWRPGVRFWSYVTFCTCTSDRKWLQNVILCTKSMQIEFFHIVHINMLIFTLNGWNEFVLALLCFKSVCHKFHRKKQQKQKVKKTKKYIRNS